MGKDVDADADVLRRKKNGQKKKGNVRGREGGSAGVQARAGEEGAKYTCSPFMSERFKLAGGNTRAPHAPPTHPYTPNRLDLDCSSDID